KKQNSLTTYDRFLTAYPNSKYKREIEKLKTQRIKAIADSTANANKQLPIDNKQPATNNNQQQTTNNQQKDNEPKTQNTKLETTTDQKVILAEIEKNMVAVEGGTFSMGCTSEQKDCSDNEKPVHSVTVSSFYISKYEVTQTQWEAIMGNNPSYFKNCPTCPVESVSWNDIQEFITKLNQLSGKKYRLPTEAEWEYAARGGKKSKGYQYAGGNSLNSIAWYNSNADFKTHPVGTKTANELGLHDMSGNVWEWCEDFYDENFYTKVKNGKANYPNKNRANYIVLRGGSWGGYAGYCRVAYRSRDYPTNRNDDYGFRIVLPVN
nr:formylglycine-generating enzyme family protein [Thermoflexibacter sp.]